MTTSITISKVLVIDGVEYDAEILCDVSPGYVGHSEDPGSAPELEVFEILLLDQDGKPKTKLPVQKWPHNIEQLVYDQALESLDDDYYDEPDWDEDR